MARTLSSHTRGVIDPSSPSPGATVLAGLRDHHVHLALVDVGELGGSVLSGVDDLGGTLEDSLAWRRDAPGGLQVRVAGPFLTAPGGFPSDRSWAPDGSVTALVSAEHGRAVVQELVAAGVDLIKVVLHTGMPLLGDRELAAVVETAHRLGRPVVAHAEGVGQAARALAAGVDVLAHTPWTERLPDDLLTQMARRTTWISSLSIHGADGEAYDRAVANLSGFRAAGGRVRYGTDLGNTARPAGLDRAELAGLVDAGLTVDAILAAVCFAGPTPGWVTWSPEPVPSEIGSLVDWFATVRRSPGPGSQEQT